MSLHFELMINTDRVVRVSISRVHTAVDRRSPHTYRWSVIDAEDNVTEGSILHHEGFGAIRLAASVLTAYEAQTRRALRRKEIVQ